MRGLTSKAPITSGHTTAEAHRHDKDKGDPLLGSVSGAPRKGMPDAERVEGEAGREAVPPRHTAGVLLGREIGDGGSGSEWPEMAPRAEALILVHQGLQLNTANGHGLHMQYKNTTVDARVDKVYTHLRPPHGQRHALIKQLPK